MAITTRDGLIAALAGAVNLNLQHAICKASIANAVSATYYSLWRGTGLPLQGATPSTAATCTNATTGAIPFTSPGSGNLYVGKVEAQCSVAGALILYDRLQAMGGLSGTVLTPTTQTVGVSIPGSRLADANGANVEWFLEWYGDTGATASNCTVTYVDQTDTSRTAPAIAIGGTAVRASRLIPIVPNAGQTIKSVTSLVLSASTGTAGSFGVTCARRIATANIPVATNVTTLDPFNLGIPQIPTNACLWLVQLCSTTSTGVLTGGLTLING
jgi:hypothetical protein